MNTIYRFVLLLSFLFFSFFSYAQPSVNIGKDTTLCPGNSITLNAGNPTATFLWSTGATTQTIVVNSTAIYWVDVTDIGGTTRDSISVLLANMNLNPFDTTLCAQNYTLNVNAAPGYVYVWRDSAVGGNFIQTGQSYTANFIDTTTFYIKGYAPQNPVSVGYPAQQFFAQSVYAVIPDTRGLRFNVSADIILDSVTIYVGAGVVNSVIQLRNTSGAIFANLPVTLTAGANRVAVGFFIAAGSNYEIVLINPTGGGTLYYERPVTFPLNYPYVSITLGAGVTNRYHYFYNWRIRPLTCGTGLIPHSVNVITSPVVNLLAYTQQCGGTVLLDATNSGASYLWDNGATTPTLLVSQSDTVNVLVDIAGCTVRDTAIVAILPTADHSAFDTSFCAQNYTLNVNGSPGYVYIWRDSVVGGNFIQSGYSYTANFIDTTTFYIKGYAPQNPVYAGYPAQQFFAQSVYALIPDTRGLRFDVSSDIILDSVTIYVGTGVVNTTIQLRNTSGAIFANLPVTLTAGANRVAVGFFIAAGSNYEIVLINPTGGGTLYYERPVTFPLNYPYVSITLGAGVSNRYHYFYNWRVRPLTCGTAAIAHTVNVLASPVVNLPAYTQQCGGTVLLDATSSGASYLWDNGATTPTLLVSQSDTVNVLVDIAGCTVRDTAIVAILPTADHSAFDTSLCAQNYTLNVNGSPGYVYVWRDSAVGGNFIQSGYSYTTNFIDTTSFYIKGYAPQNPVYVGYPAQQFFAQSVYALIPDTRGLRFDVSSDIILDSVTIYVGTGVVNTTIQLRNTSGIIFANKDVTLTAGANRVAVGFFIAAGSNYEIVLINPTGGGTLYYERPVTFPLNYPYVSITLGAGVSNRYHYFYNWRIRPLTCGTAALPHTVNVLPSPVVSLPVQLLGCGGSALLDVTQTMPATYLWNTGALTSSINVTQGADYSVTVSVGLCVGTDTTSVSIFDTLQYSMIDTTVCGGPQQLHVDNITGDGQVFWWSADTAGGLYHVGNQFNINLYDTTTFWIEGRTTYGRYNEGVPDRFTLGTSIGAFYNFNDTRGMVFDVLQEMVLDSVTIYVSTAPMSTTIQLLNSSGAIINSKAVLLLPGTNVVGLTFFIPVGSNYTLQMKSPIGSGAIFYDGYVPYPLSYSHIVLTGGTTFSGQYYFYNWQLSTYTCPTTRKPYSINVLPTPQIDWPNDSVLCGTSAVLDVTTPGAVYSWTNGNSTSSINVTQSGTVGVTVSLGACVSIDSMEVILTNPPVNITTSNDTVVCEGNIELHASGDGYTHLWYSGQTSNTPIAAGDTAGFYVTDTTTFWVEGVGFILRPEVFSETVYPHPNGVNVYIQSSHYPVRGNLFTVYNTIILEKVSVYSDSAAQWDVVLRDKFGFELYRKNVAVATNGEHVIDLGWLVNPDNDYQLSIENVLGGKLYYIVNYGFPLIYTDFAITGGYPLVTGNNNYFYNIRISRLGCGTGRIPVTVNVPEKPDFSMSADTAVCNSGSPIGVTATANNPAYSYLWNTGETTNSITVNTSGYYRATVTNGGVCADNRDIYVQFLMPPASYTASDTSICNSSSVDLIANGPTDGILLWYNIPNTAGVIHLGNPYNTYVQNTSDYRLEIAAKGTTRIGDMAHPNPLQSSQYQNFIISNTFDVQLATILDSVAVYVETAPSTFDIQLKNNAGQLIETRTVTVNTPYSKVFIPLNFALLPGTGYRLQFSNVNTRFVVNGNSIYPMTSSAGIATLTGTDLAGVVYNCFYDWHFSYAFPSCTAPDFDTFSVSVALPLNLPDSVFTCDSIQLDASNGGAVSFLWSSGQSSSSIYAAASGSYMVTMTDGGSCVAVDTTIVETPTPISFSVVNGTACDSILSSNYNLSNASGFIWNTGASSSTIVLDTLGQYSLTLTEGHGCVLTAAANITQIELIPPVSPALLGTGCYSDTLSANVTGVGYMYSWNNGNNTQNIAVTMPGMYIVTVTTANGCSRSGSLYVVLDSIPGADFAHTVTNNSVSFVSQCSPNTDYVVWDFGDTTTTTFLNPFHLYQNTGCYRVRLVAYNDCGSDTMWTWVAIGVNPLSCGAVSVIIDEPAVESDFSILPNPNNGIFRILFNNQMPIDTRIEVFDLNGRVLYRQITDIPSNTVDCTLDLPAGLYWLRTINAQSRIVKPFALIRN